VVEIIKLDVPADVQNRYITRKAWVKVVLFEFSSTNTSLNQKLARIFLRHVNIHFHQNMDWVGQIYNGRAF
jgi:hypothetical protein